MAKNKKMKVNPNPGTSEFNGGLLGYIGWTILMAFGSVLTLFIATPWIECGFQRWVARHTKINGKQVVFDGKGGQLFGKYLAWFFLGIITLTIFWWWLPIKKQKWLMKHTYIEMPTTANNACPTFPAPQYAYPQPVNYCGQQYYYPCMPQYTQPVQPVQPVQNGCCRYQ